MFFVHAPPGQSCVGSMQKTNSVLVSWNFGETYVAIEVTSFLSYFCRRVPDLTPHNWQQHEFIDTECWCFTDLPAVKICLLLEMFGAPRRDNNSHNLLISWNPFFSMNSFKSARVNIISVQTTYESSQKTSERLLWPNLPALTQLSPLQCPLGLNHLQTAELVSMWLPSPSTSSASLLAITQLINISDYIHTTWLRRHISDFFFFSIDVTHIGFFQDGVEAEVWSSSPVFRSELCHIGIWSWRGYIQHLISHDAKCVRTDILGFMWFFCLCACCASPSLTCPGSM